MLRTLALGLVLFAAGCSRDRAPTAPTVPAAPTAPTVPAAPTPAPAAPRAPCPRGEATIGAATMAADGTITLTLRATGPGGATGDGQFVYPPSHPQYASIRSHVGAVSPGGSVPVCPFPQGDAGAAQP